MSLVDTISGSISNTGDKLLSPFFGHQTNEPLGDDFLEFKIHELEGPRKKVRLVGNQLPHKELAYGGKQRIHKDYYAGYSEPVAQVLGSQESDTVIKGTFKDRNIKENISKYHGASTELAQLIDSIRLRGNLCRFVLGEWERYGFIEETKFRLEKLSKVHYELSLSIIGFNPPKNAKFLGKAKEIPFKINEDLIAMAQEMEYMDKTPDIPLDVFELFNQGLNLVSGALKMLTDFVDGLVNFVQDIQKAVERVKGLIKHALGKLREYRNFLESFDPFDTANSLQGKYAGSKNMAKSIQSTTNVTSLLVDFRTAFLAFVPTLPLARHYVRKGDTFQSLSVQYYNDAEQWEQIKSHNKIKTLDLTLGAVIEIPRID